MSIRLSANEDPQKPDRALSLRIDAHHHLWCFNKAGYPWIDESMVVLQRDFLPAELRSEMKGAKVDGAVAVQARESLEETNWLLECARSAPAILGVVGWVCLTSDGLPEVLDAFASASRLVGFREIAQGEPDGFLDRAEFNRGIAELTSRGFTYDILIHARQLVEAARFVDRHPNQKFVLDHAAKPKILAAELEPWRTNLRELARRPNVVCKVSGLVTEAHWRDWTLDSLRPYLDACAEAFGPDRLLAGSDWPVCLVASTYLRWWNVLTDYFAVYSDSEIRKIFGENAMQFYSLPTPAEASL